ncbi:hypothetical protein CGCSCA5_v012735 [Colletotrichum siamense]|nr:hypothetical protein CGCSCA5_v012735 [Colletotrichum siamense]
MFYDIYREAGRRQVRKDAARSIKKVMDVDNTQDAQLINLDDEALADTVIQRPADFPCGLQEDGAAPGGSRSAAWAAVEGGALRLGHNERHKNAYIDDGNRDEYAETKTPCDDPDGHPIRGWYNGSEKIKARILDLKELTQDQFNDALDAEEEDKYHENGQESEQDGGKVQEYRDSSLDFNKKRFAFVPVDEAPAHGW